MIANILTDGMPDTIFVDGVPFEIYTDYRTWIKVGYLLDELSMLSDSQEQYEKFAEICNLAIKKFPEQNIFSDAVIQALANFYAGFPHETNAVTEKQKENQKEKPKKPSFDFVYDAGYIYCSFMSFYHIDLYDVDYMHWWKFLTLFEGLMMSDQTSVNFVVGTRQQKINPKMSKEEKSRIQKLQKEFALPESEKTKQVRNKLDSIIGSKKEKN